MNIPTCFALISFLFVINPNYCYGTITCLQSPENTTLGSVCEGDYCINAELPGLGLIRGCLSGDLLKSGVTDQCEKRGGYWDMCICSSTACNGNTTGIMKETARLVKCYECEGTSNCSASTWCYGDYCTLTRYPDGRIFRGCMNRNSMPLLEEITLGSCVTQTIPGQVGIVCTCNERNYCNGPNLARQIQTGNASRNCQVRGYSSGLASPSVCRGDQCFNIQITRDGEASNFSGCRSFIRRRDEKSLQSEKLNNRGCMIVSSPRYQLNACFDTEEIQEEDDEERAQDENRVQNHSTSNTGLTTPASNAPCINNLGRSVYDRSPNKQTFGETLGIQVSMALDALPQGPVKKAAVRELREWLNKYESIDVDNQES